MLLPISGKYGFLIHEYDEIPIYSWNISSSRNHVTYITSETANMPKRLKAPITDTIVLRGAGYICPFINHITSFVDGSHNFKIGWNDFTAGVRRAIDVWGLLVNYRIDFNYTASRMPSFSWTATFIGNVSEKNILSYAILPQLDEVFCGYPLCDKTIETSDINLHVGFVHHVKRASITNVITRDLYRTAEVINQYAPTKGSKDEIVEFDIEGDYDYWFNGLSNVDTAFDYKFFYGPLAADYKATPKMKITNINNLITNVQTGELIQATVHLGAHYG